MLSLSYIDFFKLYVIVLCLLPLIFGVGYGCIYIVTEIVRLLAALYRNVQVFLPFFSDTLILSFGISERQMLRLINASFIFDCFYC